MRRERPAAGPIRARLVQRYREEARERVRDGEPWLVNWDRLRALEAGEAIVLSETKVFGRGPRARLAQRWFRLERDDSVTEVELIPGTGDRRDNPARYRPVR
jgi:hypothetical protein